MFVLFVIEYQGGNHAKRTTTCTVEDYDRRTRGAGALDQATEDGPSAGPTSAPHSGERQRKKKYRGGETLARNQSDGWQMAVPILRAAARWFVGRAESRITTTTQRCGT